jgi:hypothetical protein
VRLGPLTSRVGMYILDVAYIERGVVSLEDVIIELNIFMPRRSLTDFTVCAIVGAGVGGIPSHHHSDVAQAERTYKMAHQFDETSSSHNHKNGT